MPKTFSLNLLKRNATSSTIDVIIGVFGSFSYTYSDGTKGSDVIDYVARKLSKENPNSLIVTGKSLYIYKEEGGEIEKEMSIHESLQDLVDNDIIDDFGYSNILAYICNCAIFIITSNRSTSMVEEVAFRFNKFNENVLGIGFQILEGSEISNVKCECFEIEELDIGGKKHYRCKKIVKCEIPNCIGSFHKVNFASISMLTKCEFTRLIATEQWALIPEIFSKTKTLLYNS